MPSSSQEKVKFAINIQLFLDDMTWLLFAAQVMRSTLFFNFKVGKSADADWGFIGFEAVDEECPARNIFSAVIFISELGLGFLCRS